MRRSRTLVAVCAGLALASGSAIKADTPAGADTPTIALLPLQDRAGDAEIAAVVRETLGIEMARSFHVADPIQVRDAMRRLRVRDSAAAPTAALQELGSRLQATWLLAPVLQRRSRQQVPHIVLSAYAFDPRDRRLAWAGFEAASGLDQVRILGRGRIDDLAVLARDAAVRLAADFQASVASAVPGGGAGRRLPPPPGGYQARRLDPESLGLVAVVPFDAVTDEQAGSHAEVFTSATLAALHRRGIRVARPDLVHDVLRSRRNLWRGELDGTARAAMHTVFGAAHMLTGTVEAYTSGAGDNPDPRVGVAARLLAAESGEIVWMHGHEVRGSHRQGLFGRRRIHSAGRLSEAVMTALVDGLLARQPPPAG